MCGINGLIDFHCKYSAVQKTAIVHKMNEAIVYRGPDHEGMYVEELVAMGMRRLAIIDLSTGNQPIFNEDHSISIVFNGEIYNFRDLREELIELGHTFKTLTDTEVIVHGYEEYGSGIFSKLDGMFAISIYDNILKKVILARDRIGEKPLYYYKNSHILVFGSELKSLMTTGWVPKTINKLALNQYFQLTYIPSPLSIYKDVYKIMPGSYMEIHMDGTINDNAYWSLKLENEPLAGVSQKELQKELYSLMVQSVKERMVSDVPIGVFLSGGIDSTIITALMSRISPKPVNTYTIGFDEKEYDERSRAKLIADLYKTNHHEYVLNYSHALPVLNQLLEQMDEPFADSSVLPTYFISQFAKRDVKVILTGDAGDELFLGYNKYLILYYKNLYRKIPRLIRKHVIEHLVRSIPDTTVITRKLNKVISYADLEGFDLWKNLMSNAFKENELELLFKEGYYQKNSLKPIEHLYEDTDETNELQKVQLVDMQILLEGDMLTKIDRMSMLNSLEVRTPMLSKNIIRFARSLQPEYKLSKKKSKKILKDAFSPIFPKGFHKLPKSGFSVPVDYWFRNELKAELEATLSQEFIIEQGIFNYHYIQLILNEHFTKKRNRKSELWALFVFQKWYMRQLA